MRTLRSDASLDVDPVPAAHGARAGAGATTAQLRPRPSDALPPAQGFVQRRGDERGGIGTGSYLDDLLGGPAPTPDAATAGGGGPLPEALRARFEDSLGVDLSSVRVHTDGTAARSAAGFGARAYARGQSIVMGEGMYQPGTAEGDHLLAHEVAHTVQQRGGAAAPQYQLVVSEAGDALEVEADRAADAMISGRSATVSGGGVGAIQRDGYQRARNRQELVALLAEAERRITAAGHDRETALHMITSIFYGASWSTDHRESERVNGTGIIGGTITQGREMNFAGFTGRPFDQDPRAILGPQLFAALQGSQDVGGVDIGHMLMGMDARMRTPSREQDQTARVPWLAGLAGMHDVQTHATGADLVTWVGDLGGAAARLAADRHAGRNPSVETYFNPRGTDYGAPTNLNGDLAGMTAGRNPGEHGPGAAPVDGQRSIAQVANDALAQPPSQRAYVFLQTLGGTFNGRELTNRDQVLATMADRIGSFAPFYIQRYDREATAEIPQAARDVAERFLQQLLRDVASGPLSIPRDHTVRPPHPEPQLPEVEGPAPQPCPSEGPSVCRPPAEPFTVAPNAR